MGRWSGAGSRWHDTARRGVIKYGNNACGVHFDVDARRFGSHSEFIETPTEGNTNMTNATIYDMHDGTIYTEGVQSQRVCDEVIRIARRCAANKGRSVIVEDYGVQKCYRVTPSGKIWRAPASWTPAWDE